MGDGKKERYIVNLFNKKYSNVENIYPEEEFSRMIRYFTCKLKFSYSYTLYKIL